MTAISLDLTGWVLESPKFAEANAPSTTPPNDMTLGGFVPTERADYMVVATNNAKADSVRFAWSKNQSRGQFGFSDGDNRWAPLIGRAPELLGILTNTAPRLKVSVVPTGAFPYRIFITDPSVPALTPSLVPSFVGTPPAGTVQILDVPGDTRGELNFAAADLVSYVEESVYYQSEVFQALDHDGKARLGTLSSSTIRLALNPIPSPGQYPIIRIGYQAPLNAVEVATEAAFTTPASGTVQWARDKGTLKFAVADIADYVGEYVHYRGVYDFFALSNSLTPVSLGTVSAALPYPSCGILSGVPSPGGDIIVYFTNGVKIKQVAATQIVSTLSETVPYGTVQVLSTTGQTRCSFAEVVTCSGWAAYAVIGDFTLVDQHIAMRFFRSFLNKEALDSTIKDFSCLVPVEDVVMVEKLIATPIQALPVAPLEPPLPIYTPALPDPSFKVSGLIDTTLIDLKTTGTTGAYGFVIDYDAKTLTLAKRKAFDVGMASSGSAYNFDDVGLLRQGFEINYVPSTGPIVPMTEGDDYLLESEAGATFFVDRKGRVLVSGRGAVSEPITFTDTSANFTGNAGKQLVILSGNYKKSYVIDSVISPTVIHIKSAIPFSHTGTPPPTTKIMYEIWDEPEILGDRVWQDYPIPETFFKLKKFFALGPIQNSQTIPVVDPTARISLLVGATSFAVVWVATDAAFTTPVTHTAQVSQETGNINFLAADITAHSGQTVSVVQWLTYTDVIINDTNGALLLNTPLLSREKIQATYYVVDGVNIGVIQNSPRLVSPTTDSSKAPFVQVGSAVMSVVWVATDDVFSSPVVSTVQISEETGNMNFAAADVITYTGQYVSIGYQEFLPIKIWGESAVFVPTESTAIFNPSLRETRPDLGAYIYRGNTTTGIGRYWRSYPSTPDPNVAVDWVNRRLTFLTPLAADDIVTIEYFVSEAVGGEKGFTTTTYPFYVPYYVLNQGKTSFDVVGDATTFFVTDCGLLLNGNDIYLVTGSVFSGAKTTVSVSVSAPFKKSYKLKTIQTSSSVLNSAYFETQNIRFEKTQIGTYALNFNTIVTGFQTGTVIYLNTDLYLVLGVSYTDDGKTVMQMGTPFTKEYTYSPGMLDRSIRPVFADNTVNFVSTLPIVTTQSIMLRVRGTSTVRELILDTDYTVSDSGALSLLTETFTANKQLELNYTGRKTYEKGQHFTGEYIYRVVPDATNGFLGASLIGSYTVYNPDTFYFRVEPFSTIAAEVSSALGEAAASASPSSGPPGPPPPPPALNKKGKGAFYWEYNTASNGDDVARRYLLYYNDVTNKFEELFRYLDGRVVGDQHGLFVFDGNLPTSTTPVEPEDATNQIDSLIYIDPPMPVFPSPPFPFGFPPRRSKAMWKPSKFSRFYPEYGSYYNVSSPSSPPFTDGVALGFTFASASANFTTLDLKKILRIYSSVQGNDGDYVVNQIASPTNIIVLPAIPFVETGLNWTIGYSSDEAGDDIFDLGHENVASLRSVKDRFGRTRILTNVTAGVSTVTIEVDNVLGNVDTLNPAKDNVTFTPSFTVGDEVVFGRPGTSSLSPLSFAARITALDALSTPNTMTLQFITLRIAPPTPFVAAPNNTLPFDIHINDTVYHNPFTWIDDGSVLPPDPGESRPRFKSYKAMMDFGMDLKAGKLQNLGLPIPMPGQTPILPMSYLDGYMSYSNALTNPNRFPALDGDTRDDYGDASIPFRSPSPDAQNIDVSYNTEQLVVTNIRDKTTQGLWLTTGSISSNYITFNLNQTPVDVDVNDELVILPGQGSASGTYLIAAPPSGNLVDIAAFRHRQDGTVSYTIYVGDSAVERLPLSNVGTIMDDLTTLWEQLRDFSSVMAGDKVVVGTAFNQYNDGTYYVVSVDSGACTILLRAFSVNSVGGLSYDVLRGTARVTGTQGYFTSTYTFVEPDVSKDFSEVVRCDTLKIAVGKNRGHWTIDTVDVATRTLTLLESVRTLDGGAGTKVGAGNTVLALPPIPVFQSSDLGRDIFVYDTVDPLDTGHFTITSFIDGFSVTIDHVWNSGGSLSFSMGSSTAHPYKIDDNRRGSKYMTDWNTALLASKTIMEGTALNAIVRDLFATLYGDLSALAGFHGITTAVRTFDDLSVNFQDPSNLIVAGDLLCITTGGNIGYWFVEEVGSATQLKIDSTRDGFSLLEDIDIHYLIYRGNTRFSIDIRKAVVDFMNLLNSSVTDIDAMLPYSLPGSEPQYGDPLDATLTDRLASILDVRTPLSDLTASLETDIKYVDKLYDKRYGWIKYRLGMEAGTLPTMDRLVSTKVKKELELIEKLLLSNS